MMEHERWVPVPEFEELYEVSDLGRVKALTWGANNQLPPGRITEGFDSNRGYKKVNLSKQGKHKSYLLHRIVLAAFRPIADQYKMEVNHLNGNPADNRLENLEWCTRLENERHKIDVLKKGNRGSKNGSAKLTETQVHEIRKLLDFGSEYQPIAEQYGIAISTVGAIANKETWAWLAWQESQE